MGTTPEGKIKEQIGKALTLLGAWFFKPVSKGYGRSGIPDFIACVPVTITRDMVGQRVGLFVGIETKAEGGTPTAWQDKELAAIESAYGLSILAVGPKHLDALASGLRRHGRCEERGPC